MTSSPRSLVLERRSPLISVIISNYNYGQFLINAIDSVLAQQLHTLRPDDIEIVVVDDGSTDHSREAIARYGYRHQALTPQNIKITAIMKPNGGQDSAFNAGFAHCQGQLICLLDADDCFAPGKLEAVFNCFRRNPDIGWCFHTLLLKDLRTGNPICKTRAFPGRVVDRSQLCDFREQLSKGSLPFYPSATSGLCFRRSLLRRILPMPETFINSSADRYVRIAAMSLSPGYFLAKALTVQGIHDNNISTMRCDRPSIPERQIVIAYLLRTQFPTLASFANRLFSAGLTVYRSLHLETVEPKYESVIQAYWQLCSPIERTKIGLMRLYRLRPWNRQVTLHQAEYYIFPSASTQLMVEREIVSEGVSETSAETSSMMRRA